LIFGELSRARGSEVKAGFSESINPQSTIRNEKILDFCLRRADNAARNMYPFLPLLFPNHRWLGSLLKTLTPRRRPCNQY
jgi:hypothetical protein